MTHKPIQNVFVCCHFSCGQLLCPKVTGCHGMPESDSELRKSTTGHKKLALLKLVNRKFYFGCLQTSTKNS